jgi:2-(1,2-epoxy-1,2-dihydrophenyl)acetyl-CoA isomerase
MTEPVVLTDLNADGVLTITMNRPETLNSLGDGMSDQLVAAIKRASTDDDVHVVVLTGAGRGFCSGAAAGGFVGEKSGARPSRYSQIELADNASVEWVEAAASCHVPIIAAVNGPAAGAGSGIALCCDVRFMAESARMGTIFIKRGIVSDYGLAYWLPRIVGVGRAFEIAYDGTMINSSRALELGLVNRVYPDADLMRETMAFATMIAKGAPLGYTGLRRLLVDATATDLHTFARAEWAAQTKVLASADCVEGFKAFFERREPVFRGE